MQQGEVAVCLRLVMVVLLTMLRVIKDVRFTYLAAVAIVTYDEVVDLKGANWQWLGLFREMAPQCSWVKTTPSDPLLQLDNEFNRTQQHKCTATIWRQAAAISTI